MLSDRRSLAGLSAAVLTGLGLVLVAAGVAEVFVGLTADRVADLVRPELTDEGLAQHRRDFEMVTALVEGFDESIVPAVANELGTSELQLRDEIARGYPAVASLLEEKATLLPFAEQGLTNLERQQENFESADSLPPGDLPGYSGGLLNIVFGLAILGSGLMILRGPVPDLRYLTGVALIAAVMIALPLALQVPQKAQSAQRVLDSLNPTSAVVERTDSSFESATAGQAELQGRLLPALAAALGLSAAEFRTAIAQNFPETAEAIAELPGLIERYQTRVNIRHDGAPDLRTLKNVPVGTLGWFDPVFGVVLFMVAGLVYLQSQRVPAEQPSGNDSAPA